MMSRLSTVPGPGNGNRWALAAAALLGLLAAPACTDFEGDDAGECSDAADNDRNGLFDCDDPGCDGSPDCAASSDDDSGDDDDTADDDTADDDTADDDDDASSDDDDAVLVESASPLLEITAPNFGFDLATELSLLTLEGVARDDVDSVTWEIEGGASGSATGTATWSAADIPISAGDNVITVTASTPGGESGTDTLVVTSNPGAPLASNLMLSQTVVTVGVASSVVASVWLDPSAEADSVTVGPSDGSGGLSETWGTLVPGATAGFWSGTFTVEAEAEGTWPLRALAQFDSASGVTPPVTLWAMPAPTGEQIEALLDVYADAESAWLAAGSTANPEAAQQAVIDALLADPRVWQVGTSGAGGSGVWWVAEPGVAGALLANPPGTRGGGNSAPSGPRLRHPASGPGALRGWTRSSAGPAGRLPSAATARAGVSVVGNNFGISLAAFQDAFTPWDESAAVDADWNGRPCPRIASGLVVNAAANLLQFASMFDDGLIQVSSHGDSILAGGMASAGWGTNNVGAGQVAVLTRESATAANISANWTQFAAGNLAVTGLGAGAYLAFLPGWVSAQAASTPMPNSIVAMSSCRSGWNATMAQAFLGGGAGLYVGFTDYVSSSYAQPRVQSFWSDVARVKSSQDAVTTLSTPFTPDPNGTYPVAFGNSNDLYVGNGPISNGSFESGATNWSQTDGNAVFGTASQINGIAVTTAPAGSLFGYTESESGAGIWNEWGQLFCPPEGDAGTLTFQWQVVTGEYVDCSSSAPPYLRLYLDRDEGRTQLWGVAWAEICPLLADDVLYRVSGWQPASVPVTGELTANPATERITFDLGANWLSSQDSWYLIDSVSYSR